MYPKDFPLEEIPVLNIALAVCVDFSRVPALQVHANVVKTDLNRLAEAILVWTKNNGNSLDSVEKYNKYMEAHAQVLNAHADLLHNSGLLHDAVRENLSTPFYPSDEGE